MNPLYLVTGGAGFIGSHLARELIRRGQRVRVLDNFSTGKWTNLDGLVEQIEVIEGDIRDPTMVAGAMQGVDYVIHQAAVRSVPKSMFNPTLCHEVNVTGTLRMLEAARQAKVELFVFASSSSIYGVQEVYPEHEGLSPRPQSPYALSKWMGELYCGFYSEQYGLPTVCLRYFNVFGPRQLPETTYAMAVPKFIESVLADHPPPIHGDGRQSRDFTYIDNVVTGTLSACERNGFRGEVINIACGETHTMLELTEMLNQIAGKAIRPQFFGPRPGDVRCTWADISRAKQVLGFNVTVDFETGLKRTVEWFQKSSREA